MGRAGSTGNHKKEFKQHKHALQLVKDTKAKVEKGGRSLSIDSLPR
jgi:hypothetical protein